MFFCFFFLFIAILFCNCEVLCLSDDNKMVLKAIFFSVYYYKTTNVLFLVILTHEIS